MAEHRRPSLHLDVLTAVETEFRHAVLAAVLVRGWFPETARVELETLNPSDANLSE